MDCNTLQHIYMRATFFRTVDQNWFWLEKLMYKRLYNYVETKKYYQNINMDFAEIYRSTEHTILELTNKISKAMDEGKYTMGIFLDKVKAFDTVTFEIIFKKLQHYGILIKF